MPLRPLVSIQESPQARRGWWKAKNIIHVQYDIYKEQLWTFILTACNECAHYSLYKFRQAVSHIISGTGYVLSHWPLKTNTMTILHHHKILHGEHYSIPEILLLPWYSLYRLLQHGLCFTQTVNTSLLSAVFPQTMNTAIVKPLLKIIIETPHKLTIISPYQILHF